MEDRQGLLRQQLTPQASSSLSISSISATSGTNSGTTTSLALGVTSEVRVMAGVATASTAAVPLLFLSP